MLEKFLFLLVNFVKNKEGFLQLVEVLLYIQFLIDSVIFIIKFVSLLGGGISIIKGSLQYVGIYIFNIVYYNLYLSVVKENCFVLLIYVFIYVIGGDELGLWWVVIIIVVINWLVGDEENVEVQYFMCDFFFQKFQQFE